MFSFIVPNYNGQKLLSSCLKSIGKQDRKIKKEIIIIDNASFDDSLRIVKKFQFLNPNFQVKLIKNYKNLGFAAAVNQGIKKARYSYLVIMNNDLVIANDWLERINIGIVNWRDKEKTGAFFGQVLDWKGEKIESTGLIFSSCGKAFNRGNGERAKSSSYQNQEVIWGGSASVIVYAKKALGKIGLFDPMFFAYLEDVDLALRLNNLGLKTVYLPQVISYHQGGATTDKMKIRYRLAARNWWFIILKHYSLKYFLKNFLGIIKEQLKNFLRVEGITGKFWVISELIKKWPILAKKRKPILI
ncbi:MAG: glycosyltransferase family 2 protein [Candidatus Shapirobacteria bacterium]